MSGASFKLEKNWIKNYLNLLNSYYKCITYIHLLLGVNIDVNLIVSASVRRLLGCTGCLLLKRELSDTIQTV